MASKQLVGLQWLRGVAALLVVVAHSRWSLVDKAGADPALVAFSLTLGNLGVKLFFIISGFVIAWSIVSSAEPVSARTFFLRRVSRIVPLYWLTTSIYVAKLTMVGTAMSWEALLKSLLFIPFIDADGNLHPVYGLGWTLNYEMLFYLLAALGLSISRRMTLLLPAVVLAVFVALGWGLAPDAQSSAVQQVVVCWSRPIGLFFVVGMALAVLLHRHGARLSAARMPLASAVLLSSAVVAGCLVLGQPSVWVELALYAVPVLLLWLARGADDTSRLGMAATLLGGASYSIYLTHSFVVGPLARMWGQAGGGSVLLFAVLSIVLCTGVGMLVFQWIERPMLQRLSRRLRTAPLRSVPAAFKAPQPG